MRISELAGKIDLTILSPLATEADVKGLAEKAMAYPFATLCLPPCHVALGAGLLKDSTIKVSTVAGFPLGYERTEIKCAGAVRAFEDGAVEIDMVMNQGAFHDAELALVEDDIASLVSAVPGALVKVIIETCYLDDRQKASAIEIILKAGAHFVKTSTGFGPAGAEVEDVRLLSKLAGKKIGVKAAGGIKTLEQAMAMIKAGADRLGTSSGVEIIEALVERPNL